jgi:isopentenyl-diphosphate delta-isomerase
MSENSSQRKKDHIELANKAQTPITSVDARFNYEPLFFKHPESTQKSPLTFLGKSLDFPIWISSMTGGTEFAYTINQNLAQLCGKYHLGMGLGSCRSLLYSSDRLKDFAVRTLMGDQPLYANLGIAQVEQCLERNDIQKIHDLVTKIEADGLIIHLNPLQEWFQPEGDRYKVSPLETLTRFLEKTTYPVIVKEVGHGLGPKSLAALLKLPLKGIEYGAFGGTNFTLLESMRGKEINMKAPFIHVGHSALEMTEILSALPSQQKEFIISGGIKNILDGYALLSKLKAPSVIGMAQPFLNPALEGYEPLEKFFLELKESFLTAKGLLTMKEET